MDWKPCHHKATGLPTTKFPVWLVIGGPISPPLYWSRHNCDPITCSMTFDVCLRSDVAILHTDLPPHAKRTNVIAMLGVTVILIQLHTPGACISDEQWY